MTDPTEISDHDLLRRMQDGDEAAFLQLYRRRQGAVYRFALHMSGSQQVAEDVTQDVFLALVREPGRFEPERGSLAAYLYGIARNRVRQHLEQGNLHLPLAGWEAGEECGPAESQVQRPSLLEDLTRHEDLERLQQAVLALPARYREVVVLCDLQGQDYGPVATSLGCAVGTVRSRLHRVRALECGSAATAFADGRQATRQTCLAREGGSSAAALQGELRSQMHKLELPG